MKTLTDFLGVISLICLSNARYNIPSREPTIVCPCDYEYNPVCGSDGITYMNTCVRDCVSDYNVARGLQPVTEVQECECRRNCICQDVDLPVCTLDGKTYPNECVLGCENIKRIENKEPIIYLAYRTACRGTTGYCSDIAAPVCGSDNVLYRNRCVLDNVNRYCSENGLPPVTVKNNGACQGEYLCPLTNQSVCATDGNIYNNPCELEAENERRSCSEEEVFIAEADPSVCQTCICTKIRDPVCGSDLKTYDNACLLECEIRKRNDSNLRQLYSGECGRCSCNQEYLPVCGTDRQNYDNECLLNCANDARSANSPQIKVFHVGECQIFTCDCTDCDENGYQPVCGSDDLTYWNLCWLKCNDKCNVKNELQRVHLKKRGPCYK